MWYHRVQSDSVLRGKICVVFSVMVVALPSSRKADRHCVGLVSVKRRSLLADFSTDYCIIELDARCITYVWSLDL